MGDISVREYIRWLPGEPSEPTSTIVLTTPERRFVDLRIFKSAATPTEEGSSPESGDGILPLSRLDWAIAGTSSSSPLAFDNSVGEKETVGEFKLQFGTETVIANKATHCQWHHWIDSRTPNTEGLVDEGDNFEHPSNPALTLERGSMVDPNTGIEADYEELWRSEPVEPLLEEEVRCLALQWQGDEEMQSGRVRRGLFVRLGHHCQVLARDGDDITVERLRWDAGRQRWVSQVRIGQKDLPIPFATGSLRDVRLGDRVVVGGDVWEVVERA
ncbi:hypothetical protein N656DRAFT_784290 [Canariomyces notabilis]|uniref:Protein HRI1 n=1 Tax=Canariomyces notabilis TaxID=2074819 RepID=A0AAN6T8S2_9PEZI|nr:hypothetical protein N656DRAFT_784290 [Canariomyces arenarius]